MGGIGRCLSVLVGFVGNSTHRSTQQQHVGLRGQGIGVLRRVQPRPNSLPAGRPGGMGPGGRITAFNAP